MVATPILAYVCLIKTYTSCIKNRKHTRFISHFIQVILQRESLKKKKNGIIIETKIIITLTNICVLSLVVPRFTAKM